MSEAVIRLDQLSKMYRLYQRPIDKVLDVLGINRWLFWRKDYYRSFWALRNVNLQIRRGERVGLVGRNGAGKSTLLRIISETVNPTEGTRLIEGRVQALMTLGTGFHPEFTGLQNINAALAYHGLSDRQILDRTDDIVDFAELRDFIDQPVKTYSAGMYARLAFAVATSIEPDILIIDEILGAGDAYFYGKCVERMKRLTVDKGATVLFVSHDLPSVLSLCDRAIWLKNGQIVDDGEPLPVIQRYYAEVQREENSRLLESEAAKAAEPSSATCRLFNGEDDLSSTTELPSDDKSVVTWQKRDPRIEYVKFLNDQGDSVPGIEEGTDLTIELGYYSSVPVQNPVFALTIYLTDGITLCHANTVLGKASIEKIHGHGAVRFKFRPVSGGAWAVPAKLLDFQKPGSQPKRATPLP